MTTNIHIHIQVFNNIIYIHRYMQTHTLNTNSKTIKHSYPIRPDQSVISSSTKHNTQKNLHSLHSFQWFFTNPSFHFNNYPNKRTLTGVRPRCRDTTRSSLAPDTPYRESKTTTQSSSQTQRRRSKRAPK